jgi:hypothetical protein
MIYNQLQPHIANSQQEIQKKRNIQDNQLKLHQYISTSKQGIRDMILVTPYLKKITRLLNSPTTGEKQARPT